MIEQLARLDRIEATLARLEGHAVAQGHRLELLEDAVDEVLDVLRGGVEGPKKRRCGEVP